VDSSAAIPHVLTVTVGTGYNARNEFAGHAEKQPELSPTMLRHCSPLRMHASLFALGVYNVVFECNIVNVTFENSVTAGPDQPLLGCLLRDSCQPKIGGVVMLNEEK
jgi:hypothetical protein